MSTTTSANRLARETSPYLLQHAHNPVDWHPWGDEALALARETGKPILLSIGYTACHWCHVMEHESFEDHETAAYMNEHFVCIKVDREERPDLDKIYQVSHQILSQRPGGWPLTIVMDPVHHVPFFAGTYFPDQPRHGMPAFIEVLKRIVEFYHGHKDGKLPQHIAGMQEAVARLQAGQTGPGGELDAEALLARAARDLENAYDAANGGFGDAPKFPHPANLALCLRLWRRARDPERSSGGPLLDMARRSLETMANRGLFDHIGGGFYRYCVDARWTIPHFEKMLYDNAQLLAVYADAHLATGEAFFADTARRTGRWVMTEMQAPEGGYYSTLDADSEGEEGRFYVWTVDELQAALDDSEWTVWQSRFGLRGQANFDGKWHLNVDKDLREVAAETGHSIEGVTALLESARGKLETHRSRRPRPLRDEKILTGWNGLMSRAMAHAGLHLEEPELLDSADRALDFIDRNLRRDGRLLATTKDDVARLNAYLDDYVFVIDALLAVSQHRWDNARIQWARALADTLLAHFEDPSTGGMFFTSDDHEKLLYRDKPGTDDATPSGNGIAARVLLRLGHLLGEPRYLQAAERIIKAFTAGMERHPAAHAALMEALCEYQQPVETIIIRGDNARTGRWRSLCAGYRPDRQVFTIPESTRGELPAIIAAMTNRADVTAYVCRGTACSEPITDPAELERHLAHR